jgi:hypothetical protein
MPPEKLQRVSLGFQGGQVLALRVGKKALDGLLDTLPKGQWHTVEVEDGHVRVDLSQVVYVRTKSDEHRVGFGLAGS